VRLGEEKDNPKSKIAAGYAPDGTTSRLTQISKALIWFAGRRNDSKKPRAPLLTALVPRLSRPTGLPHWLFPTNRPTPFAFSASV